MARPIDYSKWKDIEVSDDEDDTHPNIDTPSLFKWRHEARVKRMEEFEQKKKEAEQEKDTWVEINQRRYDCDRDDDGQSSDVIVLFVPASVARWRRSRTRSPKRRARAAWRP